MPLNSRARAFLRRVTQDFYVDEAIVKAPTRTVGDAGDVSVGYSAGAVVQARLISGQRSFTSATVTPGMQESMKDEYRLCVPVGTEIGVDYRVEVDGVEWDVIRIVDGLTDRNEIQAVLTRRRDE